MAAHYRKLNGTKVTAEIILVGGAAVLANYPDLITADNINDIIEQARKKKNQG